MIGPIWITYSWKDRKDNNFEWLVHQLRDIGIDAQYDERELIPGQYLWSQIASKIFDPNVRAWVFLVTPSSLASKACMEELELALNRFIEGKEESFPIIGLYSGVDVKDIPPQLRIRLCISLSDLGWKEKLKAAIEKRPPRLMPPRPVNQILWKITDIPSSDFVGVEITPRFPPMKVWSLGIEDGFFCDFGIGKTASGIFDAVSGVERRDGWYEKEGKRFMTITMNASIEPGHSAYVKIYKQQKRDIFIVFGPSISIHADPEFYEWIKIIPK